MSETDDSKSRLSAVTPPSLTHPNREMDTIGWGIFLGLLVLMLPFLPFILIIWAVSKIIEFVNPRQ